MMSVRVRMPGDPYRQVTSGIPPEIIGQRPCHHFIARRFEIGEIVRRIVIGENRLGQRKTAGLQPEQLIVGLWGQDGCGPVASQKGFALAQDVYSRLFLLR